MLPDNELESDAFCQLGERTFPCLLDEKVFNREKLRPLFAEVYKVQKEIDSYEVSSRQLLFKGYVNVIYGRLLECYHDRLVQRSKQINEMVNILTYIEENCHKKLTLDELAAAFGYNRYYFSKFFNSFIGESLTSYINSTRIRRFMSLYRTADDKKLLNLALSSGFESMPSFYRAFERIYNCTPKEYFKNNNIL